MQAMGKLEAAGKRTHSMLKGTAFVPKSPAASHLLTLQIILLTFLLSLPGHTISPWLHRALTARRCWAWVGAGAALRRW